MVEIIYGKEIGGYLYWWRKGMFGTGLNTEGYALGSF